MVDINTLFEPSTEEEREEDKIARLVLSIQFALQKSMNNNCVSQKELAQRLGVSPARVSQILSSEGTNLTLRTIGRIAHALGEDFELVTKRDVKALMEKKRARQFTEVRRAYKNERRDPWHDASKPANRNSQFLFEAV